MSKLIESTRAVYFASILYRQDFFSQEEILSIWSNRFGGVSDYFYPEFNPLLDYYSEEMGPAKLLKRMLCVNLVARDRAEFVGHKLWSDQLEKIHAEKGLRNINLDIGLITKENMHLATGKNFIHRHHLGQGVYGDLNLIFHQGGWKDLPWTYPDYMEEDKLLFFGRIRQFLIKTV